MALQVGKVFPELRAMVQYLYENRRLWNEMYLAEIEADAFKTPAEKATEKVCGWQTPAYMWLCQQPVCPILLS